MDGIISLIREWHQLGQFIFLIFASLVIVIVGLTIFTEISKFFNYTLPIIFRGWPPAHLNEKDSDEDST
jgi:hypothetical protein